MSEYLLKIFLCFKIVYKLWLFKGVKNDMFYNRRFLDLYDLLKGKMFLNLIDICILFYFCLYKYVYILLRKKFN